MTSPDDDWLCRQLHENNPRVVEVTLCLRNPYQARLLGLALQENQVVTSLTLTQLQRPTIDVNNYDDLFIPDYDNDDDDDDDGCDALLNFVQHSVSLTRFSLKGYGNLEQGLRFLQAASKNSSIVELYLCKARVSAMALHSFFQTTTSLKTLVLMGNSVVEDLVPTQEEEDDDDKKISHEKLFEVMILKCPTLECFILEYDDEVFLGAFVIDLLQFMAKNNASNNTIKKLALHGKSGNKTRLRGRYAQNLANCVLRSSSLRILDLKDNAFEISTFHRICHAIATASNLRELVLTDCQFDAESTKLFESSLFQQSSIATLSISTDTILHCNKEIAKVLANILETNHSLRHLKIVDPDHIRFCEFDLKTLLRPLLWEDDTLLWDDNSDHDRDESLLSQSTSITTVLWNSICSTYRPTTTTITTNQPATTSTEEVVSSSPLLLYTAKSISSFIRLSLMFNPTVSTIQSLVDLMPKLRGVRELYFDTCKAARCESDNHHGRQTILNAVRQNCSLQTINGGEVLHFTESEQELLNAGYLARNRYIMGHHYDDTTTTLSSWTPMVLAAALHYGPDVRFTVVFQLLLRACGENDDNSDSVGIIRNQTIPASDTSSRL